MSCKVEKIHTFMDYIKGGSVVIFIPSIYTVYPFAVLFHDQVTIIFVVDVCLFVCAEFF